MLINNTTSYKGMFKYDPSSHYEKGDFVVDNSCIYLCTAENPTSTDNGYFTVTGVQPSANDSKSRSNFVPYLGNQIASFEEYENYLKDKKNNVTVEDKYISAAVLDMILQKTNFGLTESGIIKNYANYISGDLDSTDSILDDIINSPELNNGVLTIDRSLPEVSKLFYFSIKKALTKWEIPTDTDYSDNPDLYYSNTSDVVILRQYTYDTGNLASPIRWRLQELIDPVTGESYTRSSQGTFIDNKWVFDTKTSFINSLNGSGFQFSQKINALELFKRHEIEDLENLKKSLKGSFRFRDCNIRNTASGNLSTVYVSRELGNLFTILVRVNTESGVCRNISTTINTQDNSGSTPMIYRLDDHIELSVTIVDSRIKFTVTDGSMISNIYYRETYND